MLSVNKKWVYTISFLLMSVAVFAAERAKTVPEAQFFWKPVLFYGIVLGLYELFLIHADENFRGSHWLGHGVQAIFFMTLAIFAVMNVPFVLSKLAGAGIVLPVFFQKAIVFQVLIGIILNFKIHAVSAVIHTQGIAARGLAEHWSHTLLVSALVVLVPYVHKFVAQFLPAMFQ